MEDAAQAEASEAPTDSGTAGSLHLDLAIAHPQGKIMKYMSSENTYIHVYIYDRETFRYHFVPVNSDNFWSLLDN